MALKPIVLLTVQSRIMKMYMLTKIYIQYIPFHTHNLLDMYRDQFYYAKNAGNPMLQYKHTRSLYHCQRTIGLDNFIKKKKQFKMPNNTIPKTCVVNITEKQIHYYCFFTVTSFKVTCPTIILKDQMSTVCGT